MNTVNLVGRLTKDPELKYSANGVATVRFTIAVNDQYNKGEADFIGCVAFRKTAENLVNYQKKGSLIGVIGRIKTGSYDKNGQKVYTTDVLAESIQFYDKKSDGQQQAQQNNYQQQPVQQNNALQVDSDDLPF